MGTFSRTQGLKRSSSVWLQTAQGFEGLAVRQGGKLDRLGVRNFVFFLCGLNIAQQGEVLSLVIGVGTLVKRHIEGETFQLKPGSPELISLNLEFVSRTLRMGCFSTSSKTRKGFPQDLTLRKRRVELSLAHTVCLYV